MEPDVRKVDIPELKDPLCRPDICSHIHPDSELADPVVDQDAQLPLHEPPHHRFVEGQFFFFQAMRLSANNATGSIDNQHYTISLLGFASFFFTCMIYPPFGKICRFFG